MVTFVKPLVPGLYEHLVTSTMDAALGELAGAGRAIGRGEPPWDWLDDALARHVGQYVLKALADLPQDDEGVTQRISLVRTLLSAVHTASTEAVDLPGDLPVERREILHWVSPPTPGLAHAKEPVRPEHGLVHPSLLFNGRNDTQLLAELRAEIASADRIDAIIAFLKFSGLKQLEGELRRFFDRGGELRLITSTYVGATDARAVIEMAELAPSARVRIAYEQDGTRLHAKAWRFHRGSGLSTAYIGSSNLSKSALTDGAEWNVRITEATTPELLGRFQAAFDQFWDSLMPGDFDPITHRDALTTSLRKARGETPEGDRGIPFLSIDAQPKPHQARVLDALAAERERGHFHNLVVAATGTGKTWVSAFDYQRLRAQGTARTLLFVAHREEILAQSLGVFRTVLGDPNFGELAVGGRVPERGHHVFASIQTLTARGPTRLASDAYDIVVVDEFHHAAAESYEALLRHLRPTILLGLTATPERADGQSVLHWFDHRTAAEIRLWDALDQGLLCPFHYFGVHDPTSAERAWKRGRGGGGLDRGTLDRLYTADDVRARHVVDAVRRYVCEPGTMRALGFCVGVDHARRMARAFNDAGLRAEAIDGTTPDAERASSLRALECGQLQALFTVDLFNEGVDLPRVDAVLFLRPTESATVFLQQLGRGLRRHPDKAQLVVLDFVGHVHEHYRYELRYQALLGGTRAQVLEHIQHGFPKMPPGCAMYLEEQARERVLDGVRKGLRGNWTRLVEDLRALPKSTTLAEFLRATRAELEDIFDPRRQGGQTWTSLRRAAGFEAQNDDATEGSIRKRIARMMHIDDVDRLTTWRSWLAQPTAPRVQHLDSAELALARTLFALVCDRRRPLRELQEELDGFWARTPMRRDLSELLGVLDDRLRHTARPLGSGDPPVRVHATYTRDEVVAAWGVEANGRLRELREGVLWDQVRQTDLLFVTLDKTDDVFKPSVRYADYPISPTRFHWESQNRTSEASPTGQRYLNHEVAGSQVVLFVRARNKDERGETLPYTCLGLATYEGHRGERPLQIVWRMKEAMPVAIVEAGKVLAA